MTQAQGQQLIQMQQAMSQYVEDMGPQVHLLQGESQFLAHVCIGIVVAVIVGLGALLIQNRGRMG